MVNKTTKKHKVKNITVIDNAGKRLKKVTKRKTKKSIMKKSITKKSIMKKSIKQFRRKFIKKNVNKTKKIIGGEYVMLGNGTFGSIISPCFFNFMGFENISFNNTQLNPVNLIAIFKNKLGDSFIEPNYNINPDNFVTKICEINEAIKEYKAYSIINKLIIDKNEKKFENLIFKIEDIGQPIFFIIDNNLLFKYKEFYETWFKFSKKLMYYLIEYNNSIINKDKSTTEEIKKTDEESEEIKQSR